MEWTRTFYQRQYEMLTGAERWPAVWAGMTPDEPPPRVSIIERLAGPGPKRVLELGCGSGIIAGATAAAGHWVVAVDIAPLAAASARQIAASLPEGQMQVVEGDFFEIDPPGPFDAVCYFDGFGIGADQDQQRLLGRMAGWLAPGGCALIDIYNPYHFARIDGVEYEESEQVCGRTDFDPEACRLNNTIWRRNAKEAAITQSLRCYTPADLSLLLKGTGLALDAIEPYESGHHARLVPLTEAHLYLARLVAAA